jgi:predicted outer membrane repeat protein
VKGTEYLPIKNTTTLSGFIIENGYGEKGVAVQMTYASPDINKCIIQNNVSIIRGSGLYCYNSAPNVSEVIFINNTSEYSGSAIYANNQTNSDVLVTNCSFYGNNKGKDDIVAVASYSLSGAKLVLRNCIFWQNAKYNDIAIRGCVDYNCSPV